MSTALPPVKITREPVTVTLGSVDSVGAVVIANESPFYVRALAAEMYGVWVKPYEQVKLACEGVTGFTGALTLLPTPSPARVPGDEGVVFLTVYAPGETFTGVYPFRRA